MSNGAVAAGDLACMALAGAAPAEVLTAGQSACYLRAGNGTILWLGAPGTPMHRRAIHGVPWSRSWEPGRIVAIDVAGARTWLPARVAAGDAVSPRTFISRGKHTVALVRGVTGRGDGWTGPTGTAMTPRAPGAGAPFSDARVDGNGLPRSTLSGGPALSSALARLATACREGRAADLTREIAGLVGLGPGLTPLGDDIAGGLLFALAEASRLYPEFIEPIDAARIVMAAGGETHPISHAILADLAVGEGPEPLHDLLWRLLHGQGGAPVVAARRVQAIGHSSGVGLLAGVALALIWLERALAHGGLPADVARLAPAGAWRSPVTRPTREEMLLDDGNDKRPEDQDRSRKCRGRKAAKRGAAGARRCAARAGGAAGPG